MSPFISTAGFSVKRSSFFKRKFGAMVIVTFFGTYIALVLLNPSLLNHA
jgi:hypothetical protein